MTDAASLGSRFVVVETAEETTAPPYRNTTRVGFQVAYLGPSFAKVLRAE